MKKSKYALFSLLVICNMVFAQSGWVLQNPYPTGNMIFGVKFLNDNTGYFVGEGIIMKSTNGGQSVTMQTSPVSTELNSVWFTDANTGIIAGGSIQGTGNDGVILRTINGGNTWNTVSSGLPMLWGIRFLNANTGFITGKNGTILKTVNAGLNWTIINSSTTVQLWGISFINDMTGFIAGGTFEPNKSKILGDGLILKTTNGGNNWSAILSGYANTMFCVTFPNQNTGYAGGAEGTILKTINGGVTWSPLNSGSNMYFFGLSAIDQNSVTVSGARVSGSGGMLLRTTNGGTSWNCCLNPSDTNTVYISVQYSSANTGYAAGMGGKMVKTVNGGANWTNLSSSATFYDVESIFFRNETGYGVTDNGEVVTTTNGGNNWSLKFYLPGYRFFAVYFTDANTGYLCGCQGEYPNATGVVMKTTNAGSSWTTKFTNSFGSEYYALYFADNNTGYVFGGGQYGNIKTTNGGNNWMPFDIPGIFGIVTSASFLNANTGYVTGGYSTHVARTNDGGNSWILFPNVGTSLKTVFATDQNTSYAGGEINKIYKTTNSGQSWSSYTLNAPSYIEINAIYFPNSNTGYAVGGDPNGNGYGMIFSTTNAGASWQNQLLNPCPRLKSVFFTSAYIGYASGKNGLILKTTTGGIGITNISNEVPSAFSLHQNYPNPFNPVTIIEFDVQRSANISIKVYDILGREISTLVNEQLKPGTYEVDWDGSAFTSGVYFYKLSTESYTETKRMVLIK